MNRLRQLAAIQAGVVRAYIRGTADWGPRAILRRCLVVARLAMLHPVSLSKVVGALTSPKFASVLQERPLLFLKFSWNVYALGLSTVERADMLVNHYQWLGRRLDQIFLGKISRGRHVLWVAYAKPLNLEISIAVASPTAVDGELTLYFSVDSADVYILSFVIAPARPMSMFEGQCILITRLQGVKGCGDLIASSIRSVGGISPTLILMAAAQGIALALGIEHILGVNARQQASSAGNPAVADFLAAYDEFWIAIGGRKLARGMFLFHVPLPEKSLRLIKPNHRRRVKIRRSFRNAVADRVKAEVERFRVG